MCGLAFWCGDRSGSVSGAQGVGDALAAMPERGGDGWGAVGGVGGRVLWWRSGAGDAPGNLGDRLAAVQRRALVHADQEGGVVWSVGHVRLGTGGRVSLANRQPFVGRDRRGRLCVLAHNGYLEGVGDSSSWSDTAEAFWRAVWARSGGARSWSAAVRSVFGSLVGGAALVIGDGDSWLLSSDGRFPLRVGRGPGGVCSASTALALGAWPGYRRLGRDSWGAWAVEVGRGDGGVAVRAGRPVVPRAPVWVGVGGRRGGRLSW